MEDAISVPNGGLDYGGGELCAFTPSAALVSLCRNRANPNMWEKRGRGCAEVRTDYLACDPGPMGSVQEKHLHADAEALTSLRSEQLSELKADPLFLSWGETKPHGLSSGP